MSLPAKYDVLLLLDGEEPSRELLHDLSSNASVCIAADGAANYARKAELRLDAIVGDLDSFDDESKRFYRSTTIVHIADQDTNDFEKSLLYILQNRVGSRIVILGLHGKRTDHLLANLSVLVRFRDRFDTMVSCDQIHDHYFLTAKYPAIKLVLPLNTQVSLLPLPMAHGILTEGLQYPLQNERLVFGEREGLSNIVASKLPTIVSIESGALLVSIARGGGK